jgi:hypothetical protein
MSSSFFQSSFLIGISLIVYNMFNKSVNQKKDSDVNIISNPSQLLKANPKTRKRKPKRISEKDVLEIQSLRAYLDTTTIPTYKKDDIVKHRIYSMKYPSTKAKDVDVVFHGSQWNFDEVTLIPHYHANGEPVVFGATSKGFSLAFLSNWTDEDLELANINNGPLFLRELKPNAFKNIFKGKSGWLYTLDAKPFKSFRHLMRYEMISFEKPKILKKEYIKDVFNELEKCKDIILIPYGKRTSDYV